MSSSCRVIAEFLCVCRSSSESTSTPSVSSGHAMSHPDLPNVIITGQMVPDMDKAVDIVIKYATSPISCLSTTLTAL
jgi:hypothetical protein